MSKVEENIRAIKQKIAAAAGRAGRRPEEIKLMAITKTVPDELVRQAVAAGVDMIGENYVQDAQRRIEKVATTIPWHFTGHLQTNKARYAVRLFSMIHSLDRIDLARELDRRAGEARRKIEVLIEVNIGGEKTKSGVRAENLIPLIRETADLAHLSIRGLMTIPPWSADPRETRPFFRELRQLRDSIIKENIPNVEMAELSMGMSDDFETAVEEGATIIRIGRAIFGPRQ